MAVGKDEEVARGGSGVMAHGGGELGPPMEGCFEGYYRGAVFEGGGAKGVALAGTIRQMERLGITGGLDRVLGASAGAIAALLVGLGFTPDEVDKQLIGVNLNDWTDLGWFPPYRMGLYKGDAFQNWARDMVGKKTGLRNATFEDVKQMYVEAQENNFEYFKKRLSAAPWSKEEIENSARKVMENAKKFKEMYFILTCTSDGRVERFSYANKRYRDVPIASAVRGSMSLPGIFKEHVINGKTYVDGGMCINFPFGEFNEARFRDEGTRRYADVVTEQEFVGTGTSARQEHVKILDTKDIRHNNRTLGVKLDTKDEIQRFRFGKKQSVDDEQQVSGDTFKFIADGFKGIADVLKYPAMYLLKLVKALKDEQQDYAHANADSREREQTIYVNSLNVDTEDFGLGDNQKDALVLSGELAALDFALTSKSNNLLLRLHESGMFERSLGEERNLFCQYIEQNLSPKAQKVFIEQEIFKRVEGNATAGDVGKDRQSYLDLKVLYDEFVVRVENMLKSKGSRGGGGTPQVEDVTKEGMFQVRHGDVGPGCWKRLTDPGAGLESCLCTCELAKMQGRSIA